MDRCMYRVPNYYFNVVEGGGVHQPCQHLQQQQQPLQHLQPLKQPQQQQPLQYPQLPHQH